LQPTILGKWHDNNTDLNALYSYDNKTSFGNFSIEKETHKRHLKALSSKLMLINIIKLLKLT